MHGRFLLTSVFTLIFLASPAMAAKPVKNPPAPAVPAPEVISVKVDYVDGFILAEGVNLGPTGTSATFAGVGLDIDPASSDTLLLFPFSPALSAAVDAFGNYVLKITTDGGSVSLSAFIPLALAVRPEPPEPGLDCPCSTDWDQAAGLASPDGFAGQVPYCQQDLGDFVTVQYYDPIGPLTVNYWVLWTQWDEVEGTGSCELYLDGPRRPLDTLDQFNHCADYLRNLVTVYGNQGQECLF